MAGLPELDERELIATFLALCNATCEPDAAIALARTGRVPAATVCSAAHAAWLRGPQALAKGLLLAALSLPHGPELIFPRDPPTDVSQWRAFRDACLAWRAPDDGGPDDLWMVFGVSEAYNGDGPRVPLGTARTVTDARVVYAIAAATRPYLSYAFAVRAKPGCPLPFGWEHGQNNAVWCSRA